jgi:hypothetical protein
MLLNLSLEAEDLLGTITRRAIAPISSRDDDGSEFSSLATMPDLELG